MNNFYHKLKIITHQGLSILNGVVGDRLRNATLGIKMNFYADNKIVHLDKPLLAERLAQLNKMPSPKICILVHGLTNNETIWGFKDKSDYGTLLEHDFDYTPFYLRYNTGLHISENGKNLAALLEKLYENYPIKIEEISIIAHSMGGLLTHSACYYAQKSEMLWAQKLRNIFLLATPHLGSFLERFANVTTNILEKVPNWHTRMVGKVLNWRSAGIKDLRFGYLTDEDWENQHPDKLLKNNKTPIQKLEGVSYHVISGRLTQAEKHWVSLLFGDILVSTKSATARSKNVDEFNFSPDKHYEFAKTNHFKLTASKEAYEKIKSWLSL